MADACFDLDRWRSAAKKESPEELEGLLRQYKQTAIEGQLSIDQTDPLLKLLIKERVAERDDFSAWMFVTYFHCSIPSKVFQRHMFDVLDDSIWNISEDAESPVLGYWRNIAEINGHESFIRRLDGSFQIGHVIDALKAKRFRIDAIEDEVTEVVSMLEGNSANFPEC